MHIILPEIEVQKSSSLSVLIGDDNDEFWVLYGEDSAFGTDLISYSEEKALELVCVQPV